MNAGEVKRPRKIIVWRAVDVLEKGEKTDTQQVVARRAPSDPESGNSVALTINQIAGFLEENLEGPNRFFEGLATRRMNGDVIVNRRTNSL